MTPYQTFYKLCKGHTVAPSRVAKETQISPGTLTSWKKGRTKPKIENLCKIANYFDVPVTMFIEGYEKN